MSPKKETPAASSGRRESLPWAPGEEAEARQRIKEEVAKGAPYVVKNLDELEIEVLSATIRDSDEIGLTIHVRGKVVRPYAKANVRAAVVNVVIPATVERIERDD
jgi:hypothetical protein